jgi:prepilin-type N-terminal cleavage/methylation domain-containing protein
MKMEQKMKNTNKAGFTLVEIMIVVAIIGLLAAIGIPSFQKARDNARTKACINNLRVIDGAKEQYAMDSNVATGTAIANSAINEYIKGGYTSLECGAGGVYAAEALGTDPSCSYATTDANHAL